MRAAHTRAELTTENVLEAYDFPAHMDGWAVDGLLEPLRSAGAATQVHPPACVNARRSHGIMCLLLQTGAASRAAELVRCRLSAHTLLVSPSCRTPRAMPHTHACARPRACTAQLSHACFLVCTHACMPLACMHACAAACACSHARKHAARARALTTPSRAAGSERGDMAGGLSHQAQGSSDALLPQPHVVPGIALSLSLSLSLPPQTHVVPGIALSLSLSLSLSSHKPSSFQELRPYTHTHTRIRTYTHAHTRTHTHACMHAHTISYSRLEAVSGDDKGGTHSM